MSMSDGPQFSFVLNSNPKDPINVGVIPTRFKWKQMVLNSSNNRLMFTLNLSYKFSLFLLYYLKQNHLHFLEYIQLFWMQILFILLRNQMRLDLYKKDFDIIPTYTSLVLLIFERLSTFHYQTYTLNMKRVNTKYVK